VKIKFNTKLTLYCYTWHFKVPCHDLSLATTRQGMAASTNM